MGYAILAFLISVTWLITGFNYFRDEKNGMASFIAWVLTPGLPLLTTSVVVMLFLYLKNG